MEFDPENNIVKLCGAGMLLEGEGRNDEAKKVFQQAWDESLSDLEKFIAAHYLARQQESIEAKLNWDQAALKFALQVHEPSVKSAYPSLYLNIGKCYEDLNETELAGKHYQLAFSFRDLLNDDGYGKMILRGITNGLERVLIQSKTQVDKG